MPIFASTAFVASAPVIRDAAQARIVEHLLAQADPRWRRTVEAAVPGPGRRSIDLRLDAPGAVILVEVETRLGSVEEIIRELHAKRLAVAEAAPVDSRPHRTIYTVLCLPPTRHHRSIVGAHPKTISAAFPAPSLELARALRDASTPWPGDGLLWVKRRTA